MSGGAALQFPVAHERDVTTDHDLVAAVRRGDETAFTELYARYQRRIHAYVQGMVKDHGRAEDVTQEVFISAFRRMRETERPIAFKPWIYEIARNACIDAFRRGRKAEEVSFDADDELRAADQTRLQSGTPEPDAQVDAKQQLEDLCGAFGGLSETHHRIIVLRELEGLSYREIGERLEMSRPAVESTLFRARRRLTEEYEELISGERCRRVRGIIAATAEGLLGSRDQRRMAKHVAHCQPCRRHAVACGLDTAALTRRTLRDKIAAILPLPAFLRLRNGAETAANLVGPHAEPIAGWGKAAAAIAAVVLAGAGVGVGTQVSRGAGTDESARDAMRSRGTESQPASGGSAGSGPREAGVTGAAGGAVGERAGARDPGSGRVERSGRPDGGSGNGSAPAAGGTPRGDSPAGRPGADSGGGGSSRAPDGGDAPGNAPRVPLPGGTPSVPDPGQTIKDTGNGVGDAVGGVGRGVGDAVGGAGRGAGDAVGDAGGSAGDAVGGAGRGAGDAVGGAGRGAGDAVSGAGDAVEDAGNSVPGPVGDAVGGAGQAVQGAGQGAGDAVQGAGQGAGQAVQGAGDAAGSAAGSAGSAVGSAGEQAGSTAGGATGAVGDAVGGVTGG